MPPAGLPAPHRRWKTPAWQRTPIYGQGRVLLQPIARHDVGKAAAERLPKGEQGRAVSGEQAQFVSAQQSELLESLYSAMSRLKAENRGAASLGRARAMAAWPTHNAARRPQIPAGDAGHERGHQPSAAAGPLRGAPTPPRWWWWWGGLVPDRGGAGRVARFGGKGGGARGWRGAAGRLARRGGGARGGRRQRRVCRRSRPSWRRRRRWSRSRCDGRRPPP